MHFRTIYQINKIAAVTGHGVPDAVTSSIYYAMECASLLQVFHAQYTSLLPALKASILLLKGLLVVVPSLWLVLQIVQVARLMLLIPEILVTPQANSLARSFKVDPLSSLRLTVIRCSRVRTFCLDAMTDLCESS